MRKKTKEQFVAAARKVHGDKYDYSKAVYLGTHTKVCIICPEHGEFWQEPDNHISRRSICPECSKKLMSNRFRLSKEEFVRKANLVHKGKYDYSKAEYLGTEKDICIICPKHGEFWQRPHNHLHGFGCPKCSGTYVPSTEEFIERARQKYGDKYDYAKVVYRSAKEKICVICPEHGEFWVLPNNFLRQRGCPKCSGNYGLDKDSFIEAADKRFEHKYDYSKVIWKNYRTPVCIVCPEHGEFWQSPYMHLRTLGCSKCSGKFLDKDYFIEKSREIHHDKYDYSKVVYMGNKTPVCIICPKHGEFYQKPNTHLLGHGCRKCYNEATKTRLTKTEEDFLSKANAVHKGKYDYSQMQYVNRNTPIKIICPQHGAFMQTPKEHLRGHGCAMCNYSILEELVANILRRANISFVAQKTFDWLTYNGTLFLDFYLPDYDIAIECQGIQHFEPIEYFGGAEGLARTKTRDAIKRDLCEQKGIHMLYFSNLGIRYPYHVIEDPERLLKAISTKGISGAPVWQPDPELPFTFV